MTQKPKRSAASGIGRARLAVLTMFFINGAVFANWVSRIPQIQDALNLGEGQFGIVLLMLAVGVLIALSLVGGLIARYGSQRVTTATAVLLCLLLPLLAWMPGPVALAGGLFLFGMAMSSMDVAMNAQAVAVEGRAARPLMSTFHAAFSIGGFVGAAIGAGMAALAIDPQPHFVIAALGFALLALVTARDLLPDPTPESTEAPADRPPVFQLPARALWPLGIVALAAAVGEGAMADWSGIYLSNIVGTEASVAALGFAVFSIMMTLGRLTGDRLTQMISPATLVRFGGGLAALGLFLAFLMPQTLPSLIGFGAVGLGLSTVIPLAFSAAGRLPGMSASVSIAGVASIGYAGFLAGPPIIGLVAEATSLRVALLLVALLAASLLVTASALNQTREAKIMPIGD